jgi:hypothetical protein
LDRPWGLTLPACSREINAFQKEKGDAKEFLVIFSSTQYLKQRRLQVELNRKQIITKVILWIVGTIMIVIAWFILPISHPLHNFFFWIGLILVTIAMLGQYLGPFIKTMLFNKKKNH